MFYGFMDNFQWKKIASLINFLLLIILLWTVILFITESELLRLNVPILKTINYLGCFFIFPKLILFQGSNNWAHTYLSLLYVLTFIIFLNNFTLYFIESRLINKSYKISTFHPVSSLLWELIYSQVKPSIYFHPNVRGYAVQNLPKSEIRNFVWGLLNQDQTRIYFLIIFTIGFILLPFISVDLLEANRSRLFAFWNISLVMVYLQIKFIFEAVFIFLHLPFSQDLI